MNKIISTSDVAVPIPTQLPDLGPEVTSPSPAGDTETRNPSSLTDAELCSYIESAYGSHRETLKANAPYFAQAKKRFSQQGCRVPVPGKPTYEKWLERLGLSPRYIRKIVAEYESSIRATEHERTSHAGVSDPREPTTGSGTTLVASDKKSANHQVSLGAATKTEAKALRRLTKVWSEVLKGVRDPERTDLLLTFAKTLSAEDRADLFFALLVVSQENFEPSAASDVIGHGLSPITSVIELRQVRPAAPLNVTSAKAATAWSSTTTTAAASVSLTDNSKVPPAPTDPNLRVSRRLASKEELDKMSGLNQ